MKPGMHVGLGPGHIVLDADPAPPPQRGTAPKFSAHVYCGQTAGWIKVALGMEVNLSPGDFVLNGDPASPPEKWTEPPAQFLAHFYYGQMAAWIKMPLGMEVSLSPGDFVLDGDPAPSQKGAEPPNFLVDTRLVAKRLHGSSCHWVWI